MDNFIDILNRPEWDAVGVIATMILTIIMIGFTIWIATRQNKIQKEVSEQQNKLQNEIADRGVKIQKEISDRELQMHNYQHRIKCYIQIVEALKIILEAHRHNIEKISKGLSISSQDVDNLYHGCNLMIKTQMETQLLFSQKLVALTLEMCNYYMEYFHILSTGGFVNPQSQSIYESVKDIDFNKIMLAPEYPDVFQKIKEVNPVFAELILCENRLREVSGSKEFYELILAETRVI